MLSDQQISSFHANGFLNGGKVLDDATVDVLRDEIMRVIADAGRDDVPQAVLNHNLGGNDKNPVRQIVNIWQASEAFKAVVTNKLIAKAIAQLSKATELRIWHDQIQYKPPQVGGVNMWHQDAPYWPILEPMTEVSAWVALDDVDVDNGCMSMVSGSHLWGNNIDFIHTLKHFEAMPNEFQGHPIQVVACPVKKGEVHFHHALTWHGSHANTSTKPRRAIAIHYMTQDTRYVANGEHVMKQFVEVDNGEKMQGEHFPLVYP